LSNFEIADRRGKNKPEPVVAPVEVEEAPVAVDIAERHWKGKIEYFIAFAQGRDGNIIPLGRALGLRSDGNPCLADWIMPPKWKENESFQANVRDRLETFLHCKCSSHQQCKEHTILIAQWSQQDQIRLNLVMSEPMSDAMAMLERAEKSRQQAKPNLVRPEQALRNIPR
jgi:hypothetical protein